MRNEWKNKQKLEKKIKKKKDNRMKVKRRNE